MNISYITTYDASDVHNWSGTGFYIAEALKQQDHYLDFIGNLRTNPGLKLKLKSLFYNRIIKEKFDLERDPLMAENYNKRILKSLKPGTDVIFSPGSIPISLLETKIPKVFYTDATFAGMVGFYESFSNFCSETIKYGNYLEQKALESADIIIYSSQWAAETAVENYNVNPNKIKVVPFGANIESRRELVDIKKIVSAKSATECHLLFLAVDWRRKGGEMAVKIAENLNKRGIKTILHIAGIKDLPLKELPDFIINHGFISKANNEGREKINALFAKCHFLLLPTIADCTPIVYSEANSFGLPCISTKVGGIPTILKDDINGKLFSVTDDENAYASYIEDTFTNSERYKQLSYSSFNEYAERLNWNSAGKAISTLLKELH